ncbi:MAG: hypothetical protein CVU47_06150 [Chloroflexi bacterium HGW-Chloroflexi-9]|nr:MAG: hypothetical protein CVU47_06150 [Chloroflexi bacterium HGW-Chloroflexi-9]
MGLDESRALLRRIAEVGRQSGDHPDYRRIEPLAAYGHPDLDVDRLDEIDGGITRREVLLRFLLLSAVVDQGPDIAGIRDLVVGVTNDLYAGETRIFHDPLAFFRDFDRALASIEDIHAKVKAARAAGWAAAQGSTPSKYLLYMENAGQTLGYAIYRWGAPLAVALSLQKADPDSSSPLEQFLRSAKSAESMSQAIKDSGRYGLGKAIGDKAAHLFAKWAIHAYPLLRDDQNRAWDAWSYEVPFDSNAGRVMYRTGFTRQWLTDAQLVAAEAIQPGRGKNQNTSYLRVTNTRGVAVLPLGVVSELRDAYRTLCVSHLRSHAKAPVKVEFQRIPSAISLLDGGMTPGEIDDGLIKVGTTWCMNTATPNCAKCPLADVCEGRQASPSLILDVRT